MQIAIATRQPLSEVKGWSMKELVTAAEVLTEWQKR